MDIDKYTGRVDWGTQFNAVAQFPVIANRIFKTKNDMDAYVNNTSASKSCIPGLLLHVIDDENVNNNATYKTFETNDLVTYPSGLKTEKFGETKPIQITGDDVE